MKVRATESVGTNVLHWQNLRLQYVPETVTIPKNVTEVNLTNNEFMEFPEALLKRMLLPAHAPVRAGSERQSSALSPCGNRDARQALISVGPKQQVSSDAVGRACHAVLCPDIAHDDTRLGSVPPEIGDLTNLTKLKLKGNRLHELPLELAYCTQLKELEVGANAFRAPFQELEK
eukprot:2673724-Rhodomonas_salina.1